MGKRKPKPYSAKGRKLQRDREARLIAIIREKLEHIPDGTCQPDMDRMTEIINSGLTKSNKPNTWKRREKRR